MAHKIFSKPMLIAFAITVSVFAADQLTKWSIFSLLDSYPDNTLVLAPFLRLVQVWNTGISFGLFHGTQHGPIVLTCVALAITVFLCGWLMRAPSFFVRVALSLVIGGALGNIADRLRMGAVADFLDFHLFDYHWPAFNIADAAVCLGVFLLLIDSIVHKHQDTK